MHTIGRSILRLGALLLATTLAASMLRASGSASAAPPASPPTAASCVTTGPSAVTCDLWAKLGTISKPGGGTIPIWGYSDTAGGAATLPGPTIDVPIGTTLTVNLHNTLSEVSSLHFDAQNLPSDSVGAAANTGTKSYTFVASQPGTFLYEAGLTADGQHQVALGLFGALVVRPVVALPAGATGQAYLASTSVYSDEAVLVLSEIDPALNSSATPATFDMRLYAPKYWLINGQAFPSTANIDTAAGHSVLLRYLNAGIRDHVVGLLGMHQNVIATDGHALTYPYQVVAETIPAGATLDTIAKVPAAAPNGAKFAIYNAAMHLDNAGPAVGASAPIDFGGMLAFLNVTAGTTTGDTAGPLSSSLLLTPATTGGAADVALAATISDNSTGGSNIQAAEYFIDTVGANGSGIAMTGTFGSATVSVNATITVAQLAALASGQHSIYIHGRDALNNWGPLVATALKLDKAGPATTGIVLTPAVSNGAVAVNIQATGDDSATGNANVTAATYSLDGGAQVAMSINQLAPVVSLNASIPAPLAAGVHTVAISSQDAGGNVGAAATAYLTIDTTAPTTSNVVASPNPNNGAQSTQTGGTTSAPSLRVDASFADPTSPNGSYSIAAAEGFIDTIGTTGSGFAFQANDGLFNSPSEAGYGQVPLTTINLLSNGTHTIYVHAKDAAGNWSTTYATGSLVIDRTPPTFSSISLAPSLTFAAVTTLTVNGASDTGGGVVAGGEYWFGTTNPALGGGTAFTGTTANIPLDALAAGTYTVRARIRDSAGNWGTAIGSATLTIDRLFANSFPTANRPYGWSGTGGTATRLSLSAASNVADAGTNALAVAVSGTSSGYLVSNLPPAAPNNANVTSYHARFYVNPSTLAPGAGTPTIFAAMSGAARSTTVFQVQIRRVGAQYSLRATNANASASTAWVNISGSTAIEVARSGTTLTLYVGGVAQGTVAVANTALTAARLGLSAGLASGMSGTVYFDGFVSTRSLLIGL